ncbi:MAG TPA: cupin domain-containing protein [Longimicrobiales bacterium]|nr:cupin domain-containing protein [Longimicrobiales bacterium]
MSERTGSAAGAAGAAGEMGEMGEMGAPGGAPAGEAMVRAAAAVARQPVAAGRGTELQVLVGPDQGAPNFILRRFIMAAGGGIPRHTNEVEHEQYVLRGRARITIADAVHEVGEGDTLYIPAGTPHAYDVLEGPFEFLCVVPNQPDALRILEEEG